MAKGYKARPYHFRTKQGDSVPFREHAEHAAKVWEEKVWKDNRTEAEKRNHEKWIEKMAKEEAKYGR